MNATTRRLTFLVIGPASFLKERTRAFWSELSIDLVGPLGAPELSASPADQPVDGAIIDVRYEADVLLSVIDILQSRKIPALFASPMSLTARLTGGFVLSRDPEDMASIVHQLLGTDDPTLH